MSDFDAIEKNALVKGTYYLLSRDFVEKLYKQAGFKETSSDPVPNFLNVGGKECLFSENFIERDGIEYEIVIVANDFHWEDVLAFEDEDE